MTVSAADPPATPRRPPQPGTFFGVHTGQIVASQVAAALLLATAGHGVRALAASTLAGAALVTTAWVRLRGRWLYQWVGTAARYPARRHMLPANADRGAALLELLCPGTEVAPAELGGEAAAVLSDGYGLTALLELGDQSGLVTEAAHLPSPASLLPPATADLPRVRLQLVLMGVPAAAPHAAASAPATSYRQLTEGRLLGQDRAVLAVRVLREDGWTDNDLRPALSGLVRKVRRRLAPVPARPLAEAAALRVLADLAHHDGAQPAREAWPALHLGGLLQAAFRLARWPDPREQTARRIVPRLLALPAAATTVSITADGSETDLVVRVAAVDATALASAARALRRLLAAEGAAACRLDGEHLAGLAATLPLGGADRFSLPGLADGRPAPPTAAASLDLTVGGTGLMLGTNRHGEPLTVRLFRPEPTRAALIGGVRAAQLIALRAMALGARVAVQTTRPQAWAPFVGAVSGPGEAIVVVPAGRPVPEASATALRPLLVVVDAGPVPADAAPGARRGSGATEADIGWRASLLIRDELALPDLDAISRADLVVLQPLRPDEAALAAVTLGLGDAAEWLTHIREDMVGIVHLRSVRWALLSATPIELQLIGAPNRS